MPEPQIVSQAKFRREYQAKDEWGNPIGPLQVFEADTRDELIDKMAAAHENATAALYRTKRDARLGDLLQDAELDEPLPEYKEKPLSADERVKIKKALDDPASLPEGFKMLFEAQFGVAPAKIRQALQWIDASDRALGVSNNVTAFRLAHPEYVDSESNRDVMEAYLNKRKLKYTKANFEKAYEVLKGEGSIVIRADKPTPPISAAPIPPSGQVQQTPPPLSETIPPSATPAAPISDPPAVVNTSQPATAPAPSSSGLSPRVGTAPQEVPKAKEMTATELSLIISRMTSAQYAKRCQEDKAFEALVNKLLK